MNLIKDKIADFLLALFICANSISWLQLFPQMFPVILLMSCCLIIVTKFNDINSLNLLRLVLFVVFIGVFFLFTYVREQYYITDTYFQTFSIVGVTGLIIGINQFDWLRVSKYIILLFLFHVRTLTNMDSIINQYEDISGAMMGISYGILPYIMCSIYIIFCKQYHKLLKVYAGIVFFICLVFLANYGSRGPMVAILFFLLYTIYVTLYNTRKKIFIAVSVFTVVILLVYSGQLLNNDTNIYFLDKMARLKEDGDISNGRVERYYLAWNGFMESPLLGDGIGNFKKYGYNYPHNVILQILIEGGILFFIPFFILIYKVIKKIINPNTLVSTKNYFVFLFCFGLIGLLFSSYFWITHGFWLIIGNGLRTTNK